MADGCIYNDGNKNKGKLSMSIKKEDRELLESIALKMNLPISIVKDRKNINMSEMSIYNINIYNALTSLGVMEHKSLKLKWIPILIEYERDFIKGYFDGDGSVSIAQNGNHRKLRIQFLRTEDFSNGISETILKSTGVESAVPKDTQTNIKSLRYTSNKAKKVLEWMYKDIDESLYLERKYIRYKDFINKNS